jgi:hypothetical protein
MRPVTSAVSNPRHHPREFVLPVAAGVTTLLGMYTTYYFPLSLVLSAITVVMILDRLGKGIILRELVAFYMMFTCLIMPVVGYTFYTRDNALSRLWVRWMPIPQEVYFGFALPATALFAMAVCWPITTSKYSDYGLKLRETLERIKTQLKQDPKIGVVVMATGVVAEVAAKFLPAAVGFVITLVYWGAFAGVLYLYYTPNFKRKFLFLGGFAIFILGLALQNGMFTVVAYMSITLFSFFFIGSKFPIWKKLMLFIFGCALLMVLQTTKAKYREALWFGHGEESGGQAFATIFADQLGNFSGFFAVDAIFPLYYRTNQGFNISLVMKTFPARKPFDNGGNIATSFASAFVPRVLWPDKPEAGGKFNMEYYTGIKILGWSTNVGPLGEAYGSFGQWGILYMFFLGLFVRWVYKIVFKVSQKMPLIIFWIPVMFYSVTYSAETDSLQIFNSLIKSGFFLFLLWKVKPDWLLIVNKTGRKSARTRRQQPSTETT